MSVKGRPERECRSAQHEGNLNRAKGRPERECRRAQHEGTSLRRAKANPQAVRPHPMTTARC